MTFVRTDSFRRDFPVLPRDVQEKTAKALRLFAENPRHPSLRIKKMLPKARGIFEARVTRSYRMTFQVEHDTIILRRIGTHEVLRTP